MQFKSILFKLLNSILSRLSNLPDKIRYLKFCHSEKNYFILPGLTFFNGKETYIYGEGTLQIGKNTYCGSRCGIYIAQGHICRIGNNTAISHNVRIYTSNRNPNDIIDSKPITSEIFGDVVIGDNCWIGANVFIGQGVEIGDNVVIGANSVVSKSIASHSIAVGAPIKVIKKGKSHK